MSYCGFFFISLVAEYVSISLQVILIESSVTICDLCPWREVISGFSCSAILALIPFSLLFKGLVNQFIIFIMIKSIILRSVYPAL